MPLEREGGQAQFIVHDHAPTPRGGTLEPLLLWLRAHLADDLTLACIAEQAGMSTRSLIRRFREQTGTTPLQWLHRARIRQAQHLLDSTRLTVERIGTQVGFGSPTAFRDRFKKTTGVSPHSYRRSFGRGTDPSADGARRGRTVAGRATRAPVAGRRPFRCGGQRRMPTAEAPETNGDRGPSRRLVRPAVELSDCRAAGPVRTGSAGTATLVQQLRSTAASPGPLPGQTFVRGLELQSMHRSACYLPDFAAFDP